MPDMTDERTNEAAGTDDVVAAAAPEHVRGTGWIASKVPLLVTIAAALVFHLQMGEMEVGSLTDAGPGFWPRVLVLGIIVVSVLGFVADLRDGVEPFRLEGTTRVLAGFAMLAAFVFIFENTGMILAGFVFMMLWLKGLNRESWRLSLAISVAAPLVCYLLFVVALGVRLPEDIVASLWGGR